MTPVRSIRVDDGTWESWQKMAKGHKSIVAFLTFAVDSLSVKEAQAVVKEPTGKTSTGPKLTTTHPFCQIGRHDSFLSDDGVICKRCGVKL